MSNGKRFQRATDWKVCVKQIMICINMRNKQTAGFVLVDNNDSSTQRFLGRTQLTQWTSAYSLVRFFFNLVYRPLLGFQSLFSRIKTPIIMPSTNPHWLRAKPLLEEDYRKVDGIETMSIEQVIALRPGVYNKVPRSNFVNNWRAMKKRFKENGDNPTPRQGKKSSPTAWEIAKPLLEKDHLEERTTGDMTSDQVIALRLGIYDKVSKTNFVANWRALKKRIEAD